MRGGWGTLSPLYFLGDDMKKKIVCLLLAAVLAFGAPARAYAFGFAVPFAIEEIVIMLLGLCGITVSDDFDVEGFIEDVQDYLESIGSDLNVVAYLSGIAASKVLNTVTADYVEIFGAILSEGNIVASEVPVSGSLLPQGTFLGSYRVGSSTWSEYTDTSQSEAYWFRSEGYMIVTYYDYPLNPRMRAVNQYGQTVYTTGFSGAMYVNGYEYPYYRIAYSLSGNNLVQYPSIADAFNDFYGEGASVELTVSDDVINGNATDIDYNSVNDRGVLTGAFSIDLGAIADAFGSIADAWAGVRAKVRSWADVVSAGRVIPSVDDKVIEDTQANESVISNTTVAEAAASIGDVGDYDLGLENFFPFCLPWDLYNFVTLLEAAPEAPVIEWEFPVDVEGNTEHYEWSLENLEFLAEIMRTFLTLAFAVGLIFAGGKLFKH